MIFFFFFFNDTATTEIYTLSLHDALPILAGHPPVLWRTHETWRSPGHPTYSLKDAIAELPRPCKRRKSRATSRVVADLQCVSNAGPPGLVIMPVTPTRERR